jgi:hypothetical protein
MDLSIHWHGNLQIGEFMASLTVLSEKIVSYYFETKSVVKICPYPAREALALNLRSLPTLIKVLKLSSSL